ncbi:hypothetical protein HID58_045257 [Brassica napus]|uniref:Protein kinase domain-containing protein n=1 Tax=Brassica napus TaxID=3708 RepID=A0ABQ8AT08_BRANA|nr:hypothetical protein HID58_045257 [Brassica napus]
MQEALPWETRVKIAIGIAEAIAFLHSIKKIPIHQELHMHNIMLDDQYNAKLLYLDSKRIIFGDNGRFVATTYLPFEYAGHAGVNTDVFTYGVILLELFTGSKGGVLCQSSLDIRTRSKTNGRLIQRCIMVNWKERPSMQHVLGVLITILHVLEYIIENVEGLFEIEDTYNKEACSNTPQSLENRLALSQVSNTPSPRPEREPIDSPLQSHPATVISPRERGSAMSRLSIPIDREQLIQRGASILESGRLQDVGPIQNRLSLPQLSPIRSLSEDRRHVFERLGDANLVGNADEDGEIPVDVNPVAPPLQVARSTAASRAASKAAGKRIATERATTTKKRTPLAPPTGVSVKRRRVTRVQNSPKRKVATELVPSWLSSKDERVWLYTTSGEYTTKSGYKLLSQPRQPLEQQFNWINNSWKVDTMPKVQTFLWKMHSGAISSKRCGEPETDRHIFLQCPFARRTWELVPCTDMTAFLLATNTSTLLNLGRGLTNLPPSGLVMKEQEVVTLALREARNWQAAQLLKRPPTKPPQAKIAHRDPGRSLAGLVCLVDASWQASTHCAGMGWIYKDSTSGWSSSNTSNRSHVASAPMSEALAALT